MWFSLICGVFKWYDWFHSGILILSAETCVMGGYIGWDFLNVGYCKTNGSLNSFHS